VKGVLLLTIFFSFSVWAQAQREVSVIVTAEGYYPKSLTVFQGESVKFYVTSTVEAPDWFFTPRSRSLSGCE